MRSKRTILKMAAILLTGTVASSNAQSGLIASGGETKNLTGSVSFSLGQVADISTINGSGFLEEGLQHPAESMEVSAVHNHSDLPVKIYPNPVFDLLNIQMPQAGNYHCELLDMKGRSVQQAGFNTTEYQLNLSELAPAFYMLNISADSGETTTLKIFKTR